jgi:hypothetical protein
MPQPGAVPPATPEKSSNKGCIVALVVVLIIGAVAVFGAIAAITFLGGAATDAIDEATDLDGGPGDITNLLGGDCVQFQFAYSTLAFGGMFGAGAPEDQQDELNEALAEMRGSVPSEIEDDFEIVAEAFQESMALAFSGGALTGVTSEETAEQAAEAEALLESPEVVEAQNNIDTWLIENCG